MRGNYDTRSKYKEDFTKIVFYERLMKCFKLSINEYFLMYLVTKLSSDKSPVPGLCTAKKAYLANQMRITRGSVIRIINKVIDKGLLERKENFLRPTHDWNRILCEVEGFMDVSKSHTKCNEIIQSDVSKSHTKCNEIIQPSNSNRNTNKKKLISKSIDQNEFNQFWKLYDKKRGKLKCVKHWTKLTNEVKEKIFKELPKYVASTPDKQFRKDPLKWLNGECWDDEIFESKRINNGQKDSGHKISPERRGIVEAVLNR